MKRVRNQGLTLVELLVSVAVLSIVTLGIGGLLRLAATQYSNATKETEVQNLAQSAVASVTTAMEDAALDLSFDSTNKILTIANKENYIKFQLYNGTLYYDESAYSDATAEDTAKIAEAQGASVDHALENELCNNVQRFTVDASTATQGYVAVTLSVEYKGRTKAVAQNVYLRNFHPTTPYIAGLNGEGPQQSNNNN
ncbi:MAG: type II secretion system protein, partial [Lachnospiraceae bacterium]|nr:type II secretion system protein [Lachnospiraceae bacterium]